LSAKDLADCVNVPVTVGARLDLVDPRGGNAVALGVPTSALGASSHRLGQTASLAACRRADQLDGNSHPYRLTHDENFFIYDRVIPKLSAGPPCTWNLTRASPILRA
jgi:hypothetical protein